MSILCKLFGHQPPVYAEKGWWSPGEEYGRVGTIITDGIGRQHAEVHAECPRCNATFVMCRVHLPKERPDPWRGRCEGGCEWQDLGAQPNEYEPSLEGGAMECRNCGTLKFYTRERQPDVPGPSYDPDHRD